MIDDYSVAYPLLVLLAIALTEASVVFAKRRHLVPSSLWSHWPPYARWVVALQIALVTPWVAIFQEIGVFEAMLITFAAAVFGGTKTFPGMKVRGRFGDTARAVLIVLPCLLAAWLAIPRSAPNWGIPTADSATQEPTDSMESRLPAEPR